MSNTAYCCGEEMEFYTYNFLPGVNLGHTVVPEQFDSFVMKCYACGKTTEIMPAIAPKRRAKAYTTFLDFGGEETKG